MKKRKRTIAIVIAVIVFGVCAACVTSIAIRIIFGSKEQIASVDLGANHTVRIWKERPPYRRWDPDIAEPEIMYEITESGETVVPPTWLSLDFDYNYNIEAVFAEEGALALVYDTHLWDEGIFIIFDAKSSESWPRDNFPPEESYQKWADRYSQLRLENPGLPDSFRGLDR